MIARLAFLLLICPGSSMNPARARGGFVTDPLGDAKVGGACQGAQAIDIASLSITFDSTRFNVSMLFNPATPSQKLCEKSDFGVDFAGSGKPWTRKTYPTDLTDAQWKLIEPLLPEAKPGGRPRSVDLREVLDGIFYVVKGGVPWRMLPHDLPPWGTVHYLLPPVAARRHLGEGPRRAPDPAEARRRPAEEPLGGDRRQPDRAHRRGGRRPGLRRGQASPGPEAAHRRRHHGVAPGGGRPFGLGPGPRRGQAGHAGLKAGFRG